MPGSDTFLREMEWRGLLFQRTDGVAEALSAGSVSGYCGFDPTAPSLHVGHLVQVMGLVHLQRGGHRPVALVGGGTGLIGDPSGRASERALLSEEQTAANVAALKSQLERFLDFEGRLGVRLRNNAEWLGSLGAIDFMRDVGKHFTVNWMLAKESVKARLESGISYTEFSYMLLQAYDFLELYRREGVTLQTGGSDQWGNITAGCELLRRTLGVEAHGVTLPLITTSSGKKFGKTEGGGGAVWLDRSLTSPYRFYQFWINVEDADAGRYLRYFTLLGREEIAALEGSAAAHPERREAQEALALDVTARVHGAEGAAAARAVSKLLFDRHADPRQLSSEALGVLREEIPFRDLAALGDGTGGRDEVSVVDLLVETGLVKSKGDARRQIQQGAVSVNGRRLTSEEHSVSREEAIHGGYFLVRKGSRELALAHV
ncbi:MAG: tyrosine--tRNA ligase [Gemmatimonadaceae bacterium]